TSPDILSKIRNYIESFKIEVDVEEELEEDPYTLTAEDLIHIAKGMDDLKNGRTIPHSELMEEMRMLCREK
ncbi:MAG: hypothetical protein LBE82_08000, partial [Chitinophagaceae bacterium]|nr:hypothetical protein [Chitinophagaceae bacterium]